ncbi:MAG: NUDIX domain-containing protein [Anaerolineae bacterium]|nr:NUDIX domain-containing protein [Anaerolineae bacterium]MDQ7035093.1 NUDIX domain-containing protein [Anaerolineae bacterium]
MGANEQGANATDNRWLTIPRSLCFVFNGNDVLLMKRGAQRRIFPNQYNGLGGHIERDEDPLSAAKREILEESGLSVHDIRLRSVHNIDAGEKTGIMLFVYTAQSDNRDFIDTGEEGSLHWIPIDKLTDYDLVEDLPLILPRLLETGATTQLYSVHVTYDKNDEIQMRFVVD